MSPKTAMILAAVSGLVAMGAMSATAQGTEPEGMEKCYGIVKAGKNDCAANGHACAAQARKDRDPNEWIYVPDGTCDKLVGGSTKPKKT